MGEKNSFVVNLEIDTDKAEQQVARSAKVIEKKLSDALKNSIGKDELKKLAQQINDMFEKAGQSAKLNIDKLFSDKGTMEDRIEAMSDALKDLYNVLDSGGSGSGNLNKNIQKEVNKLKEQKEELQSVLNAVNNPENAKFALDKGADKQIKQLRELKQAFQELGLEKKNLEGSGLANTPEYADVVGKYMKLAAQIKSVYEDPKLTAESSSWVNKNFDEVIVDARSALIKLAKNTGQLMSKIVSRYTEQIGNIDKQILSLTQKQDGTGTGSDSGAEKSTEAYKQLKEKILEINRLTQDMDENFSFGSDEYNKANEKIQELIKNLTKLSDSDQDVQKIKDILENVQQLYPDDEDFDLNIENAINELLPIIQNKLPQAAATTSDSIDAIGKKVISVSEYVSALSGQLKEMFATAGRKTNFEYHISVDGLDIKARHGAEKEIDLATQAETYLDTLFSKSVMYGHSHRGSTSATNIYDIENVLNAYKDGISIPFHFVVGEDGITTMDFTGVSKEVVDQLMQEIESTNSMKDAAVRNKDINKIVEKFTGKSDALKTWNVDELDDLAKYMYDVSSAASTALTPIEKFQAVLDNMFGKGKVDATKYESLLSGLDKDNAKNIFNQIASIENLQPIKITDMLTMGQVNAEIDESIAKYKTLREEANLSYSDIRNEVDKVIKHYNSGGSAANGLDFFQQYFPEGEWQNVRNLLTGAYDNLISIEEVTNRIASEFGIDPDTFASIPTSFGTEDKTGADTSAADKDTVNSAEVQQLEALRQKLIEVKNAVDAKTQAFEEEYVTVDAAIEAEMAQLQGLLNLLQQITTQIGFINDGFNAAGGNTIASGGTITVTHTMDKEYALNTTLDTTNGILDRILQAVSSDEAITKLVTPLNNAVTELKNVANGIIEEHKAKKVDTKAAQARINDPDEYLKIKQSVSDAVSGRMMDGGDWAIREISADAHGMVKVAGFIQTAADAWEQFTLQVNEAGEVSKLTYDVTGRHAKEAARLAQAAKDEERRLTPSDTLKQALEHMKELQEAGKESTLQYKDSGRYTVSTKEQFGGLSKETFTTFDEYEKAMSRTTITLSNDIATAISKTNKLITESADINNAGLLEEYNNAYKELLGMNQRYETMGDSISDADLETWNKQITLVQSLGTEVTKLINLQAKLDNQQGVVTSAKRLQEYQTSVDKIFKDTGISLIGDQSGEQEKNIIQVYDQLIQRINDLRKTNAVLTDEQKAQLDSWLKDLKTLADAYNEPKKAAAAKNEADKKKQKDDDTKQKTEQKAFDTSYKAQTKEFEKYEKSLGDMSYLSDELKAKFHNLKDALSDVGDATALDAWKKDFEALKAKIDATKKSAEGISGRQIKELTGRINSSTKSKDLGFSVNLDSDLNEEQTKVKEAYDNATKAVEQYELAVEKGRQADVNAAREAVVELEKVVQKYKEVTKIASVKNNFGDTAINRESRRFTELNDLARYNQSGFSSSTEFMGAFNAYKAQYEELIRLQKEFANKDNLTTDQVNQFNMLKDACAKAGRELEKMVAASNALEKEGKAYALGADFKDDGDGRKKALTDFIKQVHGISSASVEFDKNFTKCMYTIKNSDGTFSKMTATIDAFKNQIVETTGYTGSFFTEIQRKIRELGTYLVSITGIEEVFQQIRQGVTYVKEIDSALTELKKVTNETDMAYDQFLQDMSKTGRVIGATVKDLTTMAAEWSRLGYSMKEAATLAESTAILLNVSEFDDATAASEALISTMQAFQYTADESQHVVDILNEVGKLLPVDNYIG